MKKSVLICILLFCAANIFSASVNKILSLYEEGDYYYELQQYEAAITAYEQCWNEYKKSSDKNIKESFFSLYNISCCYSLLKEYEKSEYYLKYALLAGYPYLNHILNDKDLVNLFSEKKGLKKLIIQLYNLGNNPEFLLGKQIQQEGMGGLTYSFFKNNEGKFVFTEYAEIPTDMGIKKYYGEGEYTFKNFKITLKLNSKKMIFGQVEKQLIDLIPEIIQWHEIGDMETHYYYLGKGWEKLIETEGDIIIPIISY